MFGWIFFRANSVNDAFVLLKSMTHFDFSNLGINIKLGYENPLFNKIEIMVSFIMVGILFSINLIERKVNIVSYIQSLKSPVRWFIYYLFVLLIILFGNYSSKMDFIYFQF